MLGQCVYQSLCVEIRGQLLLPHGPQSLNSDLQAWQRVPLPTEPSSGPAFLISVLITLLVPWAVPIGASDIISSCCRPLGVSVLVVHPCYFLVLCSHPLIMMQYRFQDTLRIFHFSFVCILLSVLDISNWGMSDCIDKNCHWWICSVAVVAWALSFPSFLGLTS